MKKLMIALTMLLTFTVSANAMSYEQARNEAAFLTDKMAYELNLTDEQYEAAYEVNLDYLMSIGNYDDLYGSYWNRRNMDLSYILYDWQYNMYCAASYFYRPLYWDGGFWHFGIYARYPHRDYFYFGRPNVYAVYRGGHSWVSNGGRSYYRGRSFDGGRGLRDEMGRNRFGGSRYERGSSTRITVNNRNSYDGNRGSYGGNNGTFGGNNRSSFGNSNNGKYSRSGGTNNDNSSSNKSFGTSSSGSYSRGTSSSFGGSRSSGSFSSGSSTRSSGNTTNSGGSRGGFGGGSHGESRGGGHR